MLVCGEGPWGTKRLWRRQIDIVNDDLVPEGSDDPMDGVANFIEVVADPIHTSRLQMLGCDGIINRLTMR